MRSSASVRFDRSHAATTKRLLNCRVKVAFPVHTGGFNCLDKPGRRRLDVAFDCDQRLDQVRIQVANMLNDGDSSPQILNFGRQPKSNPLHVKRYIGVVEFCSWKTIQLANYGLNDVQAKSMLLHIRPMLGRCKDLYSGEECRDTAPDTVDSGIFECDLTSVMGAICSPLVAPCDDERGIHREQSADELCPARKVFVPGEVLIELSKHCGSVSSTFRRPQ